MPIFSFCQMGCCHQPTTTQTLTRLSFSSAAILILHFLFYKYKHKLRKKEKTLLQTCAYVNDEFSSFVTDLCVRKHLHRSVSNMCISAQKSFQSEVNPFRCFEFLISTEWEKDTSTLSLISILALSVCVSESFRGLFQIISNIRIFSVRMPRCWLATTTQMCAMMAAFVPGYTLRNPYFAYSEYKTRFHFHILRALKHKYILSHRKSNQNRNNHNHFNHILWFFEIV